MAKKSIPVIAVAVPYQKKWTDNHSPGVLDEPNYRTDPSAGYYGKGKFDFVGLVADGGSPNTGDVYVQTANGVSSSKGQNKGAQYNYPEESSDGDWNDGMVFSGGNLTGM